MTKTTINNLNDNLAFIQLKLYDFDGSSASDPISMGEALEKQLSESSDVDVPRRNIGSSESGHFHLINPVCPECGSRNHIKKGFREDSVLNNDGKELNIYLQVYKCKDCGHKYSTSIKKDKKKLDEKIREKIRISKGNRGGSLRDIAKDIELFLDCKISHQTIKNYLKTNLNILRKEKNTIYLNIDKMSGYYVMDEEYEYIDGKRWYRVTIHDIAYDLPIAERFMKSRSKKDLKAFFKEVTENQPRIALTTDGLKAYHSIAEELGLIHQECIFHFFKDINKDLFKEMNKNKYSTSDKIWFATIITQMRNIFRTYDIEEAYKRLENLIKIMDDLPKSFNKVIDNKIIKKFNRLTSFMIDHFIPRTSNQAERWYHGNKKHQNKTKYRTVEGNLEFITNKIEARVHFTK